MVARSVRYHPIDAAYILPSPTQICVRLWELREPLFLVHLPATMKVTAIGLLISIVLGILLAVAMDANEKVERALYPVIVASQTIPTTAIAPLFILWFGYSIWSKVLVTILITFFPIAITVFFLLICLPFCRALSIAAETTPSKREIDDVMAAMKTSP